MSTRHRESELPTLIKVWQYGGWEFRLVVSGAGDGGLSVRQSMRRILGREDPVCSGLLLTPDERSALTRWLIENPPTIQPEPIRSQRD